MLTKSDILLVSDTLRTVAARLDECANDEHADPDARLTYVGMLLDGLGEACDTSVAVIKALIRTRVAAGVFKIPTYADEAPVSDSLS